MRLDIFLNENMNKIKEYFGKYPISEKEAEDIIEKRGESKSFTYFSAVEFRKEGYFNASDFKSYMHKNFQEILNKWLIMK